MTVVAASLVGLERRLVEKPLGLLTDVTNPPEFKANPCRIAD
jgi:hypothetical protein